MPAWRDSSWQIDKLDPVYAVSKGSFLYEPMGSGSIHINPALCRISSLGGGLGKYKSYCSRSSYELYRRYGSSLGITCREYLRNYVVASTSVCYNNDDVME